MTAPSKAIVLMSGGIDSSACAQLFLSQGLAVEGLFIDHGQAAAEPEINAVAKMASHLGISYRMVGLTGLGPFSSGEL